MLLGTAIDGVGYRARLGDHDDVASTPAGQGVGPTGTGSPSWRPQGKHWLTARR